MNSFAPERVVTVLMSLMAVPLLVLVVMLARDFKRRPMVWAKGLGRIRDWMVDSGLEAVVAAVLLGLLQLSFRATMTNVAFAAIWLGPLALVSLLAPWFKGIHRSPVYVGALLVAYAMTLHWLLPEGSEGPQAMGAFLIVGLFWWILLTSTAVRLVLVLSTWTFRRLR